MEYIDLLGAPFVYGGRSVKEGFDCYGLVMELYRRRGIQLPTSQSTDQYSLIHRMINDAKPLFTEIAKPEPYCLATFMIRPPYTTHIGVVLEDARSFIHIMQKRLVAVERLDHAGWAQRNTGYFRWES